VSSSPSLVCPLQTASQNVTSVFACLEEQCQPLMTGLGQAYKDLANINTLRCLAQSVADKTAAGNCFNVRPPARQSVQPWPLLTSALVMRP
jgi:hypothetical protein